jgi:hypothetical protein
MNAFAAAEQNGKAADLQKELEDLFERQNRSEVNGATSIPATFLEVTVAVRAPGPSTRSSRMAAATASRYPVRWSSLHGQRRGVDQGRRTAIHRHRRAAR